MIVGGLQPAVVEAEGLAPAILEVEFAIVMSREVPRGEAAGLVGVERPGIKEAARIGEVGHGSTYRRGGGPDQPLALRLDPLG
jgi:hypothetical protein